MGQIIILVLIGLVLVLTEIFLVPGIGVAGILGVLSMCGASYFAFIEFGTLGCIIVTAINVSLFVILAILAFRAKTWKRLSLNTNIDSRAVMAESELVQVGQRGKSMTRLAPSGTVRFDKVKVEARAFEGMIDSGVEVEVVLIEDNKIYVKQI